MAKQEESHVSFTEVDGVDSIIADIKAEGWNAWEAGGGFQTDMPEDMYDQFMARRGYVIDSE